MRKVFLSSGPSIIRWAYNDVINSPDIEYCEFDVGLNQGAKRFFFRRKIARLLPFWFKKKIYGKLLGYNFFKEAKKEEEILFIVTCQYGLFMTTTTFFQIFIRFLKRMYPKAKFAFYYNDMIETCLPEYVESIKEEFDIVLSFDKKDVEKYELEYYEEVYSKNIIAEDEGIPVSDVFYVGCDRGRFLTIIDAFKKISDLNKKAVFYVFDILEENKKLIADKLPECVKHSEKEIRYKNSVMYCNVYCPYPKTLALINKSKCLLEITLPTQTAPTLRLPEAIVYNKNIITNCKAVVEREYFNQETMMLFKNINEISDAVLSDFIERQPKNNEYDFSPLKMVDYIINRLYQ